MVMLELVVTLEEMAMPEPGETLEAMETWEVVATLEVMATLEAISELVVDWDSTLISMPDSTLESTRNSGQAARLTLELELGLEPMLMLELVQGLVEMPTRVSSISR